MKLVDMKRDALDSAGPDAEARLYPAGLRLVLDDTVLERLDLDDVAVGDVVSLAARAKVVAYSENAGEDDVVRCRLELQVTALGVDGDADAARARRDDDRLNELGGYG